jgi:hypothetical protein
VRFSSSRTSSKNSLPSAVRVTPRGLRRRSSTPISSSKSCTCRLNAGCATRSRAAALVKLDASPTARKYRRCRSSVVAFHYAHQSINISRIGRRSEIGTVLSSSTRVHRPSAAVRRCCARRSKNAAIDDKLCSLDVSCLIRREKEDGAGYIFGPTDAIKRNHRLEAIRSSDRSGSTRFSMQFAVTRLSSVNRG